MRKPPFGGLNCRQRSGLGWCLAWRLVAVWFAVWLVDAMQCFYPEEIRVLLFAAATQGFKVKNLRRELVSDTLCERRTAGPDVRLNQIGHRTQ